MQMNKLGLGSFAENKVREELAGFERKIEFNIKIMAELVQSEKKFPSGRRKLHRR